MLAATMIQGGSDESPKIILAMITPNGCDESSSAKLFNTL
jgi:hypothetical protein